MKILSIDGGGIKGLYSAAFLSALENRFGKQTADCFDLIAGTSTGGILALALAARIPAQEIVAFYKEWGPQIFPWNFPLFHFFKSLLLPKYKNENLASALKQIFKKLKIKDIYNKSKPLALCIPSINSITGKPYVFKTQHHTNLKRDLDCYLWQIALATSAAPIFFPLAKIESSQSFRRQLFVDGGLWANNPTKVALVEALTYLGAHINDVRLLSIGNIKSTTTFSSGTVLKKGLLLWREKIISMTLETQSISTDYELRLLFKAFNMDDNYIRIEENINSLNHQQMKELDCTSKSNLNDLEEYGRDRAHKEGVKEYMINIFMED